MSGTSGMSKNRIVWSSAGEIELPDLPPQCKNQLHVNIEWMKDFMDLYWGRKRRFE